MSADRQPTYRDVFASREFRALFAADFLSVVGDQMARVAVAILVFNRSHSALLASLAFAVTLAPWLIGGPLLSPYADRMPRRRVMVVCDLARFVLVALLALPGVPIWAMLLTLGLVALLGPPFSSARAAMLPDVLPGELYVVGQSASSIAVQAAQVAGFLVGGGLVALITVRGALVADAVTFLVSGVLTVAYVVNRPAPAPAAAGLRAFLADSRSGLRVVWRDPVLRSILVVAWTGSAVLAVPEGLAVVYARHHHGGSVWAGVLTAAQPLGVVAGSLVVGRVWDHVRRAETLLPLAVLSMVPLAAMWAEPPLVLTTVLWVVAGACSAFQLSANRLFAGAVPPDHRGRAFAIAVTGLYLGQSTAFLVGGALSDHWSVGVVTAAAAGLGLVTLGAVATQWPATRIMALATGSSPSPERPNLSEDEEGGPQPMVTREHAPRWQAVLRQPATVVWLLTAGLATTTALIATTVLPGMAVQSSRVHLPWWALAPAFAFCYIFAINIEFRQQARSVTLTQIPLVLGLYFQTPHDLLVSRLVAAAFVASVVWRQPAIKWAFNLGRAAFDTTLAVLVFRALAETGIGPETWGGATAATYAEDLSGFVLVAAVIAAYEGGWQWRQSLRALPFNLVVVAVNSSLALVAMTSLHFEVLTGWALAVVALLSAAALRAYQAVAARKAALDRLYSFARELGPVASAPEELGPALREVRDLMHADRLELALVGEPADSTVITVEDDGLRTTSGALHHLLDASSREVLSTGTASLRPRQRPRPWDRATSPEPDGDDLIAVPVNNTAGLVAVLRAQHRSGDVRGFDAGDVRLLEAVADQLGTALEKGRLIHDLRRAATCDALTGLANLEHARTILNRMLTDPAGDDPAGVVVLLLNLSRFQDVNDTLGHEAGDLMLVEVARRLLDACPAGASAARVGGDQFVMLLPGPAGGEVARLAALAVKSRVEGPIRLSNLSADVRVAVGITRAPAHGGDATTLLRRAEIAMTAAKGTSGGIAEWEEALEQAAPWRLALVTGLRQALADGEVAVHYQPKLRLGTGEVTGMEALARWRHPELGNIPPSEFVPLAEASGLVGALTTHVMRRALEDCRSWHQAGRKIGVAVNLSARSLTDPVLLGQVAALLTASRVDPHWLTLEITESSVMENPQRSIDVLRQLRSLGVRLSIDDFGTGYSSLTYVKGLPVHELKVDRAFVTNIAEDGADRAVVRAIVELARSFGLSTVAEGVEDTAQALALEDLAVEEVQGYFYARPMEASAARTWLKDRRAAKPKG